MLFFSQCGALGDFITKSPPAFGFYLCQVNWTEESGLGGVREGGEGSWNPPFLDHSVPRSHSRSSRLDERAFPWPDFFSIFFLPDPSLFSPFTHELIFMLCCVTRAVIGAAPLWGLCLSEMEQLSLGRTVGFVPGGGPATMRFSDEPERSHCVSLVSTAERRRSDLKERPHFSVVGCGVAVAVLKITVASNSPLTTCAVRKKIFVIVDIITLKILLPVLYRFLQSVCC